MDNDRLATITTDELTDDMKIRVCAVCLKASCWLYIFLCDSFKDADVISLPVSRLRELGREHPDYWAKEIRSRYGRP